MATMMTKRQLAWFRDEKRTQAEREAFMRGGEPDYANMMHRETHEEWLAPMLRGVQISSERCKTYKEALAIAQAYLDKLRAKTDLPQLDEAALGIDETNRRIWAMLEEDSPAPVRVEKLIHIASMVGDGSGMASELREFLDHEYDKRAAKELARDGFSGFQGWFTKHKKMLEDPHADVCEAFGEWLYDEGETYGWLVQVATPSRDPGKSWYSWGCYTTRWFYGESYEAVLKKGQEWAGRLWKEHETPEAPPEA